MCQLFSRARQLLLHQDIAVVNVVFELWLGQGDDHRLSLGLPGQYKAGNGRSHINIEVFGNRFKLTIANAALRDLTNRFS